MPRERRPLTRSVVATDMDFVDKSATAVNFLMFIYGKNVNALGNIATAQAEGNKEVLISYLSDVRNFCEKLIKDIKGI